MGERRSKPRMAKAPGSVQVLVLAKEVPTSRRHRSLPIRRSQVTLEIPWPPRIEEDSDVSWLSLLEKTYTAQHVLSVSQSVIRPACLVIPSDS